jgi:Zn-dependent peptidase ImmA (M78 family)
MEKIVDIINREHIFFDYDNLNQVGDVQGLYTIHPKIGPIILLDKSLHSNLKTHRCVAAHELGHHFHPPRSGIIVFHSNNYSSQQGITIHQDENKALRWSTELLMPSKEVWAAIKNGYDSVSALADYFNVTEWFARAKIGYIRREERKKGRKLKWRDIIRKEQKPPAGGFGTY